MSKSIEVISRSYKQKIRSLNALCNTEIRALRNQEKKETQQNRHELRKIQTAWRRAKRNRNIVGEQLIRICNNQ